VLAVHRARRGQPLAQRATGEGGDQRPQVGDVGVGELDLVGGRQRADRVGVERCVHRRGRAEVEALEQLVDERAAHAQVERGSRRVGALGLVGGAASVA
jgi:hypothetical protein